MLKITALCNAGVLIEYRGSSILIDGISADFDGFTGLGDTVFKEILHQNGSFASLSWVFFTHIHPDHYDPIRTDVLKKAHPNCCFFIPDEKISANGCIQCGPFSVLYYEIPHMPQDFEPVRHFVLLVIAGGHSVYFASDAVLDPDLHRRILHDAKPEYLFVNPVYLSMQPMRQLLKELAPKKAFVYHIPSDPSGQNGIRRKAERSIERWKDDLPPLKLVDHYPMRLL